MPEFNNPLNNIKVAAPCSADWNSMIGDERTRHCQKCEKNVFNLSNMTRQEAENLIRAKEGNLCVRFYQRADGTILTQNCPVGVSALKKKVARVATAALSAVLSFFAGIGFYSLAPKQLGLSDTKSCNLGGSFGGDGGSYVVGAMAPMEPITPPPIVDVAVPLDIKEVEVPPVPLNIRMSEGKIRKAAAVKEVPDYPSIAKAANVKGDVVVEISIDQDGNVASAHVVSGHPLLQQAALVAAKKWQFDRDKLSKTNANVNGVLTFRFAL